MCGSGVTSSIAFTVIPADCRPVIALSRPEPGPFHADFHFLDAELGSSLRTGFRSTLGSERSALAATLEARGTGGCPAEHIAVRIGNCHRCIVECRLHMRDCPRDVPTNLLFPAFYLRHGCPLVFRSIFRISAIAAFAEICFAPQSARPLEPHAESPHNRCRQSPRVICPATQHRTQHPQQTLHNPNSTIRRHSPETRPPPPLRLSYQD